MCVDVCVVYQQCDVCVLFQFGFDGGECCVVVEVCVDDFDVVLCVVCDVFGEGVQVFVVVCDQDQVVVVVCEVVCVDGVDV